MSFKTSVNSVETTSQYADSPTVGDGSTTQKANTPVPFTEYRNVNKLPFTADYVDVKLTWDEADMVEDVTNIEEYLTELVHTGELDNSIVSAKEKLKKLEKMAGIDKFESTAQKLIKLSEFVTYLRNINKRKQWQA